MGEDKLPEAELEVLACLWHLGESTARELRNAMENYRPMAHSSVVTLLTRLENKGWVSKRKGPIGKAFLFRAARKPDSTYRQVVGDVLERIFANDGLRLIASVFETQPPTRDQVARLRALLENLERQREQEERTDG